MDSFDSPSKIITTIVNLKKKKRQGQFLPGGEGM